jgi:gas vesicle protein
MALRIAFLPHPCDIAQRMKLTWRFLLGAVIGAGVGYAMVLLVKPAPRRRAPRWRTPYQASPEQREEQTNT